MIYFTSDTHFADEATLRVTGRPFKDTNEMDKALINNWNGIVKPEDTVYVLGDFGALNYTNYLNGKKILIKGNREYTTPDSELQKYFDFVYVNHVACIYENDQNIFMTHKPVELPNQKLEEGLIQLFGHIHRTALYRPYGLNVGTDVHYYIPIGLDEIIKRCEFIRTYYDQGIFK